MKHTILILTLLLMLSACICEQNDDDPADEITKIDAPAASETFDDSGKSDTEIKVSEFFNLAWSYDEDVEYPYLTKNEILAFDNHAYYIGPVPNDAYPGHDFTFYIGSRDRTLFGYTGFLCYNTVISPKQLGKNVTAFPSEVVDVYYEYTGDGNDVPFSPKMTFTIPNLSPKDFFDIMEKIAEYTSKSRKDLVLLSGNDADINSQLISSLRDNDASISHSDKIIKDSTLFLSCYDIEIPNCSQPCAITVQWVSEEIYFAPNRVPIPELYPWEETIYNRLVISMMYMP